MSADTPAERPVEPMLELVRQLPQQLAACPAILDAAGIVPRSGIRRVVITGMGGSAAAAGLARGIFRAADFQVDVNGAYTLPGAIDERTLLIFSSYSGETEEVLAAYEAARKEHPERPRVVISSGGSMRDRAQEDRIPWIEIPGGLPPRASLGYGVGCLFGLLGRLGLADGIEDELEEAQSVLRAGEAELGVEAPAVDNPARRLARLLYGKLVVLYAGTGLGEAVAARVKAQINENSKALAYVAVLPELDHNEIVAWEGSARVREDAFVIALRDRGDHPRVQRRFEVTRETLGERVRAWENVHSRGTGPLARAMSLVQFGDYLSVYLAGEYGVPAVPVDVIGSLKRRLSEKE